MDKWQRIVHTDHYGFEFKFDLPLVEKNPRGTFLTCSKCKSLSRNTSRNSFQRLNPDNVSQHDNKKTKAAYQCKQQKYASGM